MKDRHLHIPEDTALLKLIYRQVDQHLAPDKPNFVTALSVKFLFYALFAMVSYFTLFTTYDTALFIFCFVAYGFAILLFAFNFAHDFSHGTIFRKPTLDTVGFVTLYTLNGAHAESWKKRHIESHHHAPNVEHYDSDLEISKLIRVIPGSRYQWFHKFQHFYAPIAYTTYSLYWVFVKDFVIYLKEFNHHRVTYHLSFWAQKVFYVYYILGLPLLWSQQSWYVVVIGFIVMHLCQSVFLLFTFFMTHHVEGMEYPKTNPDGYINASWLMNQVKSSNDMYPFSRLSNFIFGGFNNHIAHHLFPHVHHLHYPTLNKILYPILIDHDIIPNQTTYWGGIRSHLRLLRSMGNKI